MYFSSNGHLLLVSLPIEQNLKKSISTLPFLRFCSIGNETRRQKTFTKGIKVLRKTRVYIASPYTLGDVAVNVRRQMVMYDHLLDLGYAPFAPLYSHFQHMYNPREYQVWVDIDLEWVLACDCLLRLEGESKGADGEVDFAKAAGIPVFYSLDELVRNIPKYQEVDFGTHAG